MREFEWFSPRQHEVECSTAPYRVRITFHEPTEVYRLKVYKGTKLVLNENGFVQPLEAKRAAIAHITKDEEEVDSK